MAPKITIIVELTNVHQRMWIARATCPTCGNPIEGDEDGIWDVLRLMAHGIEQGHHPDHCT